MIKNKETKLSDKYMIYKEKDRNKGIRENTMADIKSVIAENRGDI